MPEPLISIVIPTCDRSATLSAAALTALDQDMDEIEIIISDNFSSDRTPEVAQSFVDPRLVYIRTPRRLSMCDHWEFALEHTRGDYVIFFGDDDGMMPGACRFLAMLFRTLPSPIYYWDCDSYIWPGAMGGPAIVPQLATPRKPRKPRTIDLAARTRKAMRSGSGGWQRLPKLYHSAVARCLLNELRIKTGRVFHSTTPDVFLAFALPALCPNALDVGTCLTVDGRSSVSRGFAPFAKDREKIMREFGQEYAGYRIDPSIAPRAPESIRWVIDAILVANRLFPNFYALPFNHTASYALCAASQSWRDPWPLLETIRARQELRRYHRFGVVGFFCWYLRAKLARLMERLRRKLSTRATELATAEPLDIRQCVRLLARAAPPSGTAPMSNGRVGAQT